MTVQHLNVRAKEELSLSDNERIRHILSARWIGYTRAKEILFKLESLLAYPPRHRMPNALLIGDTNNGKTHIIKRFQKDHPTRDNPGGDGTTWPVVCVQAPPVPDEGRFYSGILETLGAPFKPNDRVDNKQFQVMRIFRRINTRMLCIDEVQHILAGTTVKQRNFLNMIKFLGNELQIPIVGVGTQDALNALQTDPQLSNRFEPLWLPKWQMGQEFLKLLSSFEKAIPLKEPSKLVETNLALKLLSLSEGTIGGLSELLGEAAVKAVKSGTEQINLELLKSVNWVPPSERRQMWRKIAS